MDYSELEKEIKRLNFEDLLWLIFALLSFLNIYGDYNDKEYLKSHDDQYEESANKTFTLTLIVTFFIYIYFFSRNYKIYEKVDNSQKDIYFIKVFGSLFLIVGTLCLLYLQLKKNNFIGSPAI